MDTWPTLQKCCGQNGGETTVCPHTTVDRFPHWYRFPLAIYRQFKLCWNNNMLLWFRHWWLCRVPLWEWRNVPCKFSTFRFERSQITKWKPSWRVPSFTYGHMYSWFTKTSNRLKLALIVRLIFLTPFPPSCTLMVWLIFCGIICCYNFVASSVCERIYCQSLLPL